MIHKFPKLFIVLIVFLPLFLPERASSIIKIHFGYYSINMPEFLLATIILGWLIIIIIKGKLKITPDLKIYLIFTFYIIVFLSLINIKNMEDFSIFAIALFIWLISWLGILIAMSDDITIHLKHWSRITLTLIIFLFIQIIIFGIIISGNIYGSEQLGPLLRIRTTMGAATATGHGVFLLLLFYEACKKGMGENIRRLQTLPFILVIIFSISIMSIVMILLYLLLAFIINKEWIKLENIIVPILIFIIILLLLIAPLKLPKGIQNTRTRVELSKLGRLFRYQVSMEYFLREESYLIGKGFGAVFSRKVEKNYSQNFTTDLEISPHNTYIYILCELGLIGLIFFLFFLLSPIIYYLHLRKKIPVFRRIDRIIIGYFIYLVIGMNTENLIFGGIQSAIPFILVFTSTWKISKLASKERFYLPYLK